MREIKSWPQHIKSIDGRKVTTLFSLAGNVDSYLDRMFLGAFAKTFRERGSKVYGLWNHDFTALPIASVKALREVGRAELPADIQIAYPEAMGGAEADLEILDTPRGNEALAALSAGVPLEASFAYDAVKFDFSEEDGNQIRNLREVRLYEVSLTLWGANSGTRGAKTAIDAAFEHLNAILTEMKRGDRHSEHDYQLIDEAAARLVDLGARNVKLIDPSTDETDTDTDDKSLVVIPAAPESRAEQATSPVSLTLMRHQRQALELLDFIGAQ